MDYTLTITEDQHKQRLDKALSTLMPEHSRMRWQALIKDGHVKNEAGDAITQPSLKVETGMVFKAFIPPAEEYHVEPEPMDLEILFEDEHLIVLNKPAGLTVHPAPGNWSGTLVNGLLAHCQVSGNGGLSGIGGVERPGIIHRLDKDTSGVMVVAKGDAAHRKLSEDFKDRNIIRSYVALCYGTPIPIAHYYDEPIGRHPNHRTKMAVVKDGRDALTQYKTLESFTDQAAYLQLKLHTGRTHQIRVHLSHHNHPIIGDPVYGRIRNLKGTTEELSLTIQKTQRQMLHAQELGFTHPITGEDVHFTAQPPEDFQQILTLLQDAYSK